jgi:hypothetical protein
MRRPGLWVANGQPQDMGRMWSWRPGAVACFYNYLAANSVFDYKAANPEVPVLVRFQHPHDWNQDIAGSAQRLGQYVASKWSELQALEPYICFASQMNMHYENGDPNPANQPHYTTPEFYQKYGEWVRLVADVIKQGAPEMRLVTPPFAFGFNEDGAPDDEGNPRKGWAGYDYLYETIRDYFDNVLTFHAFWGYPAGGSVPDWLYNPELSARYAFRWRRILKLFETRYQLQAKLFIDEVASFGPADPDFTDQLIYYAQQCLSDPRVLGLTYLLWSDSTGQPRYRLNSWEERIPNLEAHLQRLQALPAGVLSTAEVGSRGIAPDKTIRVLFEDGTVQPMPLEEYLRAVVPGEMPALWPMEALKVQAVGSRSYAQYAIERPRHAPHADICTTVHCQHYAPGKIRARSDEAIQQTQGVILLHEGRTVETVFSARCGGRTQNNEDVWKRGRPLSYLRSVECPDKGPKRGHGVGFCQYGARAFADQGRTYEEILKHYYQGITLGRKT